MLPFAGTGVARGVEPIQAKSRLFPVYALKDGGGIKGFPYFSIRLAVTWCKGTSRWYLSKLIAVHCVSSWQFTAEIPSLFDVNF